MFKKFPLLLLYTMPSLTIASPYLTGDVTFTVKNEWRETDRIQSLGLEAISYIDRGPIGFAFNSSIGFADVAVESNTQHEEYLTWDTGLKFGYFGQVFAYGEVGVDLFDFILHDLSGKDFNYRDERWHEYDDSHQNNIDGYVGLGIGFNAAPFRIEAFARARQIDGDDWQAQHVWFSGVQVSVSFP